MAPEVRIEDFYGHHAFAAGLPPKQLFERPGASFCLGPCSERLQGRKKILSTKESYYWGYDLI
jgi:hypothetical protein